jgi:hypothetical protein
MTPNDPPRLDIEVLELPAGATEADWHDTVTSTSLRDTASTGAGPALRSSGRCKNAGGEVPVVGSLDLVRRLGVLVESVHAVVYFAPEPQEGYAELGLRGYWRGYFASRAAALGPVGPELVTALFGGFAPAMVARALPAVWTLASPEQVRAARLAGATLALRRLLGDEHDMTVAAAAALTGRCVAALPLPGRPMAAAQAAVARPVDPLAALWHDCTVLREHRGDGHLAAVAVAGLVWPEPHLLHGSAVDPRQQEHRGWDDESWRRAADRVRGRDLRAVEITTDRLAAPAYDVLAVNERRELVGLLEPLARAASLELPYPNAMGLPPL